MLKLTKLGKLTTEDCALFDDVGWEFVQIMLRNKFTKFLSSGVSQAGANKQKKSIPVMLEV